MAVLVWFDAVEVKVLPGSSAQLTLTVENAGENTETFTLIPAGLAAAWTTVERSTITLFAGSTDTVDVTVRPPAIHTTSAGPTAVAIRVIPQSDPDDTAVAETLVRIESFDERRIVLMRPLQRARRRATFEFMVANHGNSLANCRLHLVDPSNRVDGTFNPPAVGVAPGASTLVQLRMRVRRSVFRSHQRQLQFGIEATEPDHAPILEQATLIQTATIPTGTLAAVLGTVAVAGAIVGAWLGVIRPELRNAAERAVDNRIGELTSDVAAPATATTTISDPTTASTPPGGVIVAGAPGVLDVQRVAVAVPIGNSATDWLTVPADREFLLTDVVLQNPNADLGTASLLRNDDVLYEWNLSEMASSNEFQPRVSALPFEPNDRVVLSVSCDAAGSAGGTGCAIAVLLTGSLVPVGG